MTSTSNTDPPIPANTSLTDAQADLLSYTIGGSFRDAETNQFHESPLYELLALIFFPLLFVLRLRSTQKSDQYRPYPQPRLIPNELGQIFSLRRIVSATPDMGLFLRRAVENTRIALLLLEIKPLSYVIYETEEKATKPIHGMAAGPSSLPTGTGSSKKERVFKRQIVDWANKEALNALVERQLRQSLTQIFTQSICLFLCHPQQQELHIMFVCGSRFSLLLCPRPPHFNDKAKELGINVPPKTDSEPGSKRSKDAENVKIILEKISIHSTTISELLNNARPRFLLHNEPIFQTHPKGTEFQRVDLSNAFRVAVKMPIDAHQVEYWPDPFFRLNTASYVPDTSALETADEIFIKGWFDNVEEGVLEVQQFVPQPVTPPKGRSTSSYAESPIQDPKNPSVIIPEPTPSPTPSPGYVPDKEDEEDYNLLLEGLLPRPVIPRGVKRQRTNSS
ncbi:hypothetical protein L218DRAFT_988274 [Marasmius fiardii PR-910]|nr:hypothetical protein L218DRAFT_988274 [Marasmius fiardii PR-910]